MDKLPLLAAVGSAFAAFHQYISKPLRRHVLSDGAGDSPAVAKAATAAAFALPKLEEAAAAAEKSKTFVQMAVPLSALKLRLASIDAGLRAGQVDAGAIVAARGEVNSISLLALAAGQPIQEVVPKLP